MGTLRRILTTGVGAALMTESSLRNALSDIQLTRQAKTYLLDQILRGKQELIKVFSAEFKKFLEQVNLQKEIHKALEGLTVDIKLSFHRQSSSKRRD